MSDPSYDGYDAFRDLSHAIATGPHEKGPEEIQSLTHYVQKLSADVKVLGMAIENNDPELFGFACFDIHELIRPSEPNDGSVGTLVLAMMFDYDMERVFSARNSFDGVLPRYKEAMARFGIEIVSSEYE